MTSQEYNFRSSYNIKSASTIRNQPTPNPKSEVVNTQPRVGRSGTRKINESFKTSKTENGEYG